MIHTRDVRVGVAAGRVGVHNDHVVGRVHPRDQLNGNIAHAVQVALRRDIELVRMERLHVTEYLDLAASGTSESTSTFDECCGRRVNVARNTDRERGGTRQTARLQILLSAYARPYSM